MSATSILDIAVEITKQAIQTLQGTVQERAVVQDVIKSGSDVHVESLCENVSFPQALPTPSYDFSPEPLAPFPAFVWQSVENNVWYDALNACGGKDVSSETLLEKLSTTSKVQEENQNPQMLPPASTDLNELKNYLIHRILQEGREALESLRASDNFRK